VTGRKNGVPPTEALDDVPADEAAAACYKNVHMS
jgi:hypothetical protein